MIARGRVEDLVARHAPSGGDGRPPTLETVYLALTGRSTVEPETVSAP